jgi:DNA processing protein
VTNPDEMAELAPLDDETLASRDEQSGTEGAQRSADGGDRRQTRVLDALAPRAARSVEEVARRSGLSVTEVQGVLGGLELDGIAVELEGGWVSKR